MKITINQLAARLCISQQKVSYWIIKEPEIKSLFVKEGRRYWINENKIEKFEKIVAEKRLRIPYKQWTQTALECRERNCICEGCVMERYCKDFDIPPMKEKVIELVRLYGEPNRKGS